MQNSGHGQYVPGMAQHMLEWIHVEHGAVSGGRLIRGEVLMCVQRSIRRGWRGVEAARRMGACRVRAIQ